MTDLDALGAQLSAAVREIRLERSGMLPPLGIGRDEERRRVLDDAVAYSALPQADRDNFRDLAEAALRVLGESSVKRETLPPPSWRVIAAELAYEARRRVRIGFPTLMRHAPRRLLQAALAECAVRATTKELIGGRAYAGPDGVDYERMWWALEGKLPPGREEEIRRPVESDAATAS